MQQGQLLMSLVPPQNLSACTKGENIQLKEKERKEGWLGKEG